MFGISGEHLLILLVVLLIFGPKRLPDLGHSVGRTMKNFRDAMNGNNNPAPPVQQSTPRIEATQAAATVAPPAAVSPQATAAPQEQQDRV